MNIYILCARVRNVHKVCFSYSNDRHNDSVDEVRLQARILRVNLLSVQTLLLLIPCQPI